MTPIVDMRISIEKTEVMKIARMPSSLSIAINSSQLKKVREFKYLGSIFTEDGRTEKSRHKGTESQQCQ